MLFLVFLVLLGTGQPPVQSFGRLPAESSQRRPRQPAEYTSNSGAFTFIVSLWDPQDPRPFPCGLVHNKETVWSATLPWEFDAAGVADDGTVVGYENRDKLRIVVIDPRGALCKEHVVKYTEQLVDVPGALPRAGGQILIHDGSGVAWIRVDLADQSRPSPWWVFRLASGERLVDVRPVYPVKLEDSQHLFAREDRVIANTGLTLCLWGYTDYEPQHLTWPQRGGVFCLVDLHGRNVWTLELRDDYTVSESEAATEKLKDKVEAHHAILSTGPGDRFTIWHVRERKSVEYEVKKEPPGSEMWRVSEVSRKPYDPDADR